jgi:hypothetical protein
MDDDDCVITNVKPSKKSEPVSGGQPPLSIWLEDDMNFTYPSHMGFEAAIEGPTDPQVGQHNGLFQGEFRTEGHATNLRQCEKESIVFRTPCSLEIN